MLRTRTNHLTASDIDLLITSMEYTLKAFRETGITPWGSYPSYEFKMSRISEAKNVLDKLRAMRKKSKGNEQLA